MTALDFWFNDERTYAYDYYARCTSWDDSTHPTVPEPAPWRIRHPLGLRWVRAVKAGSPLPATVEDEVECLVVDWIDQQVSQRYLTAWDIWRRLSYDRRARMCVDGAEYLKYWSDGITHALNHFNQDGQATIRFLLENAPVETFHVYVDILSSGHRLPDSPDYWGREQVELMMSWEDPTDIYYTVQRLSGGWPIWDHWGDCPEHELWQEGVEDGRVTDAAAEEGTIGEVSLVESIHDLPIELFDLNKNVCLRQSWMM